ncbi:hypothetical protein DIREPILLOW8_207 [Vibrio phage Direpillow8]|nr:hypothetical protein DIREPILLOW8_1 [Vibrio phage Direpillow8]QKN85627.1 hypothetical protein DIREPILLOW8_207 [Vibrio phage Direpillow8]
MARFLLIKKLSTTVYLYIALKRSIQSYPQPYPPQNHCIFIQCLCRSILFRIPFLAPPSLTTTFLCGSNANTQGKPYTPIAPCNTSTTFTCCRSGAVLQDGVR